MIRIIQAGLGPLGQKMVQFAQQRKGLKIVAAVDTDPAKIGRDLGELCGLKKLGIKVAGDVRSALRGKKADAAILTTVSSVDKLVEQVRPLAAAGLDIVSTCEELSYPFADHAAAARTIDRICRQHGVRCVGTGVNPGYLMDYLPVVLTAPCQRVDRIDVSRVQDATFRRGPFQKKIGAGLSVPEFKRLATAKIIRHVGLGESINMIARAMGWKLDKVTESIRPVLAKRPIRTEHVSVKRGGVAGVEQIGRGLRGGKEVIRLHFIAAVGQSDPADTVWITGQPNIVSTVPGGVNGDIATCAITLNCVAALRGAAPGLRTMPELPAPCWLA